MIIIEKLHRVHFDNPRVLWSLMISDLRDHTAAGAELAEFTIRTGIKRPPTLIGLKPDIWPNYHIIGKTEYNVAVSAGAKVIECLKGRVKGCYA